MLVFKSGKQCMSGSGILSTLYFNTTKTTSYSADADWRLQHDFGSHSNIESKRKNSYKASHKA